MSSKKTDHPPLREPVAAIVERLRRRYPDLAVCCHDLVVVYRAITETFEAGGTLFLCGNGGSFADAVHIKGELAKSFGAKRPLVDKKVVDKLQASDMGRRLADTLEVGFPVIVLGESHSLRSAFENDRDPVLHYAQELNSFAPYTTKGVVMGISTSGNAENVFAAVTLAKAYGLKTIGFTGPDGGLLAKQVDLALKVPNDNTSGPSSANIQENQLPIYHTLCLMIEAHFFG